MKKQSRLNNQSGMAMFETIPILVIFLVLFSYMLGLFGMVHTGILNSISSRAYAFETFRNRNNLVYFRDRKSGDEYYQYSDIGVRFHTVNAETMASGTNATDGQFATLRPIAIGRAPADSKASVDDHNERILNLAPRNRKGGIEASPAWIMVGYGICINAQCGDR